MTRQRLFYFKHMFLHKVLKIYEKGGIMIMQMKWLAMLTLLTVMAACSPEKPVPEGNKKTASFRQKFMNPTEMPLKR